MMLDYLLRLIPLLLLVCALAVLALWLYRRMQPGMMGFGQRERAIRIIDAQPIGPLSRLAVVEFAGKRYLIAVSRGRVDRIAEVDAPRFVVPDGE
jgi:flagellar protein FliO/FliZ